MARSSGSSTRAKSTKKTAPPKPATIAVVANKIFHDGMIAGGVGANWKAGEERRVTPAQYKQLKESVPPGWFRVVVGK